MLRITRVVVVLGSNFLCLPSVLALDRPKYPGQAIPPSEPQVRLSVPLTVPLSEIRGREKPSAAMISDAHLVALGDQAGAAPKEPGVHLKTGGGYLRIEPEALTWRMGSFSTSGAVTKANVSGRTTGPRSEFEVADSAEFLIVLPKGVSRSPFQLLVADVEKDRRDFDLELAWRDEVFLGWSGKKKKTMTLDIEELTDGVFQVKIPSIAKGEYGFLLPSFRSKAGLPAEKVYAFRSRPDSQAGLLGAAVAEIALPYVPGVYAEMHDGYVQIKPETFEWYPLSFLDTVKARTWGHVGRPSVEYDRFLKWERMNATLLAKETELTLPQGARFAIICTEGMDAADYRLVSIESKLDERKVRLDALFVNHDTYLGFGKLPLSPGPEPIAFQAERLAAGKYRVTTPSLKCGQYGFLGPGVAALGQTGSVHAFEIR